MIKMIIFELKKICFIFHDLITFHEKFKTLIYQDNDLLRYKMNFLLISNFKCMYLHKIIYESMINKVLKYKNNVFKKLLIFLDFLRIF